MCKKLCGLLNFMGRGIVPGRAFTRRLYAITNDRRNKAGQLIKLKQHHHVRLSHENIMDMKVWIKFLQHPSVFCKSFMDFSKIWTADEIKFFTDSSKNINLGCGSWCDNQYFYQQWNSQFICVNDLSIAYLESYAVTVGVYLWLRKFRNRRIIIKCNNQAVVQMINNTSSSCKHCMILIRVIVLQCLVHNVRLFTKYVKTDRNEIADALSRLKFVKFKHLTRGMNMKENPESIPNELWPIEKVWDCYESISTIYFSKTKFSFLIIGVYMHGDINKVFTGNA